MVMQNWLLRRVLTTGVAVLLAGGAGCSNDPKPAAPPDAPADPQVMTDAQFERLKKALPDGVCDFTRPGVGQQAAVGPLDFSAGPGGTVLPDLPAAPSGLQIKTLSNRPDLISGGDAFVEIVLPAGTPIDQLAVKLGSTSVTDAFALHGGRVTGVLTGLVDGENTVTADVGNGPVTLNIINHKIGGPVFSGAQVTPFTCATPTAVPEMNGVPASNASGLSTAAIDAQCNIATEVKLWYHSTDAAAKCANTLPDPNPPATPPTTPPLPSCFKPYDPANPPADLATTTTDTGATVPYIVRVERGTLNRGIYDIAVLFDPAKDVPQIGWKPFAPQAGWNGKVVYTFGASTGQPRQQFRSEQSWTDDAALSRGFMVALNSMTDSLYNSNRVTMSETVMMMKEKIIDTYGEINYTIGNGCSGGSINQLTAASIFPGLVDGIQPTCTYPDSESTGIEVADCALLVSYYNSDAWKALTAGLSQAQIDAKKAAINGHVDQTGCHAWVNSFSNLVRPGNYTPVLVIDDKGTTMAVGAPTNNCRLPAAMVYDPATHPDGVRCTAADHAVALLGTVPGTHRARDTRDNVGVQYGLAAYLAGQITAEDFVTLNEQIGGQDFDGHPTASRTAADADALATVYRAGIVADGKQLAKTPIIDLRGYDDTSLAPLAPPGAFGIHHVWRSFALRDRLDAANGNHDNHVMWRFGTGLVAPPASGLTLQSFLVMDRWVQAIKADGSPRSLEQKIAANRPAEAADFCVLGTDFATKVTNFATCDMDAHLKPHASPRQVAGGPQAENVLKCQLRPLSRDDYKATAAP